MSIHECNSFRFVCKRKKNAKEEQIGHFCICKKRYFSIEIWLCPLFRVAEYFARRVSNTIYVSEYHYSVSICLYLSWQIRVSRLLHLDQKHKEYEHINHEKHSAKEESNHNDHRIIVLQLQDIHKYDRH